MMRQFGIGAAALGAAGGPLGLWRRRRRADRQPGASTTNCRPTSTPRLPSAGPKRRSSQRPIAKSAA